MRLPVWTQDGAFPIRLIKTGLTEKHSSKQKKSMLEETTAVRPKTTDISKTCLRSWQKAPQLLTSFAPRKNCGYCFHRWCFWSWLTPQTCLPLSKWRGHLGFQKSKQAQMFAFNDTIVKQTVIPYRAGKKRHVTRTCISNESKDCPHCGRRKQKTREEPQHISSTEAHMDSFPFWKRKIHL